MRIKTPKRKKAACLTQKAQNAYKRIKIKKTAFLSASKTSKRKEDACLTFCIFLMLFMLFMPIENT